MLNRLRFPAVFLCSLTLLALSGLHAAQPAETAKPDELVELPKMTVKGEPVSSYGMGVAGQREPGTKKIKRLIIYAVTQGSEAEKQGLKSGDEILSINGQKIAGMDGTMMPGYQLFDLLVDQPSGQTLSIEVSVHTTRNLTLQAIPDISLGVGGKGL